MKCCMNATKHYDLTRDLWPKTDSETISMVVCFSVFRVDCVSLCAEVVKSLYRVLILRKVLK